MSVRVTALTCGILRDASAVSPWNSHEDNQEFVPCPTHLVRGGRTAAAAATTAATAAES